VGIYGFNTLGAFLAGSLTGFRCEVAAQVGKFADFVEILLRSHIRWAYSTDFSSEKLLAY
jgi:hypothetical protein